MTSMEVWALRTFHAVAVNERHHCNNNEVSDLLLLKVRFLHIPNQNVAPIVLKGSIAKLP